MTNCGASSESCCTSLEVPGGTYYRTYANSGSGPTGNAEPATVSGFRLDKYEVTVGRFRQFVGAWSGTLPAGWGKQGHLNGGLGLLNVGDDAGVEYESGWVASYESNVAPTDTNLACDPVYATWTASVGSNETLPINCVNWYEAYAFCIWDGGFLPSEAEWEYAAAGGSQQREYPWGSADPGTGNQYAIYFCDSPSALGSCNVAPVGTAPLGAGRWGQLDLAGNVNEWTLDAYATYVDPCSDCADLAGASYRVFRAGDFLSARSYLVPAYRSASAPIDRNSGVGIRCARSP
jgi:sulfatase modifying factor 1